MIATTEKEMIAEVMQTTGLSEFDARIIVEMELGQSPGDIVIDGKEDAPFDPAEFQIL